MKRIGLALVGVVCVSVVVLAGTVITNDTGEDAIGLRVTFSAPVLVTDFGDALTSVDTQMQSYEFVFSGGTVKPWDSQWFNYAPATASVVQTEWFTQVPATEMSGSTDLIDNAAIPESHVFEMTFAATLSSDGGSESEVEVTRHKAFEAIPFWVEYSIEQHSEFSLLSFQDCSQLLDAGVVPAYRLDDFEDQDLTSRLGTQWTFQDTDPSVPLWEFTLGTSGNGLVLKGFNKWQHANQDNFVEVPLNGLDASSYDGVYVEAANMRIQDPTTFRVLLDSVPVGSNASCTTYDTQLFLFPFGSSSSLTASSLETLRVELLDNRRLAGIAIGAIGFYRSIDNEISAYGSEATNRTRVVFHSNAFEHSVDLLLVDRDGDWVRYTDSVDFPLHEKTEILLDSAEFSDDDMGNVSWSADNGDLGDSVNHPVKINPDGTATLVSQWPDVLLVRCETPEGSLGTTGGYEAIVSSRTMLKPPVRSIALGGFDPVGTEELGRVCDRLFPILTRCGFTAITVNVTWWYGQPDSAGRFTIQPFYAETDAEVDPRGFTQSDRQLSEVFARAREVGLDLQVQLLVAPYNTDAVAQLEYGASGYGPHQGFLQSDGWLYSEQGLGAMLVHYADFLTAQDVALVALGAEQGQVVEEGGTVAQRFFRGVIDEYRTHSFAGYITYGTSNFDTGTAFRSPDVVSYNEKKWDALLNPDVCGVPYGDMDCVALTQYVPLATTRDATTHVMYQAALSHIAKRLSPFSLVYQKPVNIIDSYCLAYDGAATDPLAIDLSSAPVDIEEQERYMSAWLRAYGTALDEHLLNLVGFTPFVYTMWREYVGTEDWTLKVAHLNDKPGMQKIFMAYYVDKPTEEPSIWTMQLRESGTVTLPQSEHDR